MRPFQWEVWLLFIFTIFVSGPTIYFVIVLPSWWKKTKIKKYIYRCNWRGKPLKRIQKMCNNEPKLRKYYRHSNEIFYLAYIKEMSYGVRDISAMNRRYLRKNRDTRRKVLPMNLLNKCIWFAITLFLRQCK